MLIRHRQDILDFEEKQVPDLPSSVYGVLTQSAARFKEHTAIEFFLDGEAYQDGVSFTYAELLSKVNAAANMFNSLGIGSEDVVTYILPNLPETMFTVYGAETAGIVNAVNPMLDPAHMIDIMNAAGSKVLVTLAPFPSTDLWEKACKIIPQVSSLTTVLTVNMGDYLGIPATTPSSDADVEVMDFNTTLKKFPTDQLSFHRDIQRSDIASYFHTGGTTGRPKIAQHTHDNEVFNAWVLLEQLSISEPCSFFCGLPWFHVNGVIVTGLLPLTGGHTIVLGTPGGYRGKGVIANFWKIVEHFKIGYFSSVPTILQMLSEVPQQGEDISSLRLALCGAAPLSVKLFNDFEESTGIKILEGYGFTEGTCGNSGNPASGERKVGSIGLANAHHHMNVVILDEDKNYVRDAAIDEVGTIVARGRNVFPGYKEDIHNDKIFVNDGSHVWYNTGDLGRRDADSFYWLTGRKKELIIRGGHNIDPKSIEEPLSKHPAVAAVAAVARPDRRVGELPAAYIQLKPHQTVTIDELLDYAKDNIKERAAVPKFIEIIEQLPLTAVGKIFKPTLVKQQIKEVFEKDLLASEYVATANVNAVQHPKKGLIAQINVTARAGQSPEVMTSIVDDILGGYTVKYELI